MIYNMLMAFEEAKPNNFAKITRLNIDMACWFFDK